jgi:hypothetical protein
MEQYRFYTCAFDLPSGRQCEINLYLCSHFTKKRRGSILQRVYRWLWVLDSFTRSECSTHVKILLILSPLKKELPTKDEEDQEIGSHHANTAFTYSCKADNEIVIFREEEWYKVLIHETFHAFGMDFSSMSTSNDQFRIHQLFKGMGAASSNLRIYEAYTETWATFLHLIMKTAHELPYNGRKSNTIVDHIQRSLFQEQRWSAQQCAKVLHHYGITYEGLVSGKGNAKHYVETKTSIFSYYVLKSIFMIHINEFLLWCMHSTKKNDIQCISFVQTETNQEAFGDWITTIYNDSITRAGMNRKGSRSSTIRMTFYGDRITRSKTKKKRW